MINDDPHIMHSIIPYRNRFTRTETLPPVASTVEGTRRTSYVFKQEILREHFKAAVEAKKLENEKRLKLLNHLKTADEIEDAEFEEIETKRISGNIQPDDIGTDVVMMENTDKISERKKKIYDIIIKAFKDKGISDASLYAILQTIPYIDIVEDVIVIYTKMMDVFDKLEVPCVNIATALKEGLNDENLKIKFVSCKIKTIVDYFTKVNWNATI